METTESPLTEKSAAEKAALKSPPCDQCRRRKVRCNAEAPCDRCIQSGLRCTRDIVRKRRGPKKGSGSVIAKLRDEVDPSGLQNVTLPPYDLSFVKNDDGLPHLSRTASRESLLSSSSTDFSGGPTSYPTRLEPRSAPLLEAQDMPAAGHRMATSLATPETNSDLPLGWRTADPYASLQYPSPGSSDFLTVNELAQKIFDGTDSSPIRSSHKTLQ